MCPAAHAFPVVIVRQSSIYMYDNIVVYRERGPMGGAPHKHSSYQYCTTKCSEW
jgi:hypothetical protein